MKHVLLTCALLLLAGIVLHAGVDDSIPTFQVRTPLPSIGVADTVKADPLTIAHQYVQTHLEALRLLPKDITGMQVSDRYTDRLSGITRIWFQQYVDSVPVNDAILNVNITKDGRVYFVGNRFISGLGSKTNTNRPRLDPSAALNRLTTHLGLPTEPRVITRRLSKNEVVFEKGTTAKEEIRVKLMYQLYGDSVLLAWDIFMAPIQTIDSWSTRIDATNGRVLDEYNLTLYCHADDAAHSGETHTCENVINRATAMKKEETMTVSGTGAQYNVWAPPLESPLFGSRTIVSDPADPVASPLGWHDIDGLPGAEFTITRGNNTYTYQDRNDLGYSSGDEPDGGPELHFDFPWHDTLEPEAYTNAAVVNLFYWINYMHDFSYRFGFDEAAGNFQKNNYGQAGLGNDFIWSVAQSGANTDLANNAVYMHRNEGTSSSIFMFQYYRRSNPIHVTAPQAVAGLVRTILPGEGWGAGAYLTSEVITGELVFVDDGVEAPYTTDACEPILNAAELQGKIAVIDRGGCQFSYKALRAQEAGAIAVIFLNNVNSTGNLAAGPDAPFVNIPVLLINQYDCASLRPYIGNGLQLELTQPVQTGPDALDSDLQSSSIAHEYGHGISIRLAGGPSQVCMKNEEQLGEGWSDYFSLVTTVLPGDVGETRRGLGTYVMRESIDASGMRRYPYSTDMQINPLTYADVAYNQEKHAVGEIWTAMLWDMYWAMVDEYGWSEDPYVETSGNYKAIRLVMDGLKNVACSPGFVDGRDAILAADDALYGGANHCLLWRVFARRGLGYSADQGSSFDAGDQREAFDVPPSCSKQLYISKSVTDFIVPGEEIEVTLQLANYKDEPLFWVSVTDEIADGTAYKENSASHTAYMQNGRLVFDIGPLLPGEETTISYTLTTSAEQWSVRHWLDDVADQSGQHWLVSTIGNDVPNDWTIQDSIPGHTGALSWSVQEINDRSVQVLTLDPASYMLQVDGTNPALRFYHRYNTRAGINGGVIEVREAGATQWQPVQNNMLRNGYGGKLDYRTFNAHDMRGYSGDSGDDFEASYIDLSEWKGRDIQVRFRFATIQDSLPVGAGWFLDDIEYMDLLRYDTEACAYSGTGDTACVHAPAGGVFVESGEAVVSAPGAMQHLKTSYYPNPASDKFILLPELDKATEIFVSVSTLDGRLAQEFRAHVQPREGIVVPTGLLSPGLYVVKLLTETGQWAGKIVIE